jgi:DNA-binding transcriptional ArsR family regulator
LLLSTDPTGLELKATRLRGTSDVSGLEILESLRRMPRTVGEIVESTGFSQFNDSTHLGCTRGCGLVIAEMQYRFVTYRLGDDHAAT